MADTTKLDLALIDESADERALVRVLLEKWFPDVRVREVSNAAEFALSLRRGQLDAVITEIDLSWITGGDLFRALGEGSPGSPVVALTRNRDPEALTEAFRLGCHDVLFKDATGYLALPGVVRTGFERAQSRRLAAHGDAWLGTLLDRVGIGVYRSTLDGRWIEATPAMLRLLGVRSLEEALRVELPKPRLPGFDSGASGDQPAGSRTPRARRVEIEQPEGRAKWLEMIEVPLLDVDGEVVVDVLAREVGDDRTLPGNSPVGSRIEELERLNADLSQFASMAAHELQEPLRMVEKFGEILAQDYGEALGQDGTDLLDGVVDGSQRMQNLVADLLALSRIGSEKTKFVLVDSNEVLERALANLGAAVEESGIDVLVRRNLPSVHGDFSQLVLLWQNLLSNAIKFRASESPWVRIDAQSEGEEWVFSVEDNGVGIEAGELDSVFEIFRRLHPELPGTGVGLALCKRIVERHGGRIWVESAVGEGSEFFFSIPLDASSTDLESPDDGAD